MEEWKDIPGYEGIYEASNFGRIRHSKGERFVYKGRICEYVDQPIVPTRFMQRRGSSKQNELVDLRKNGRHKTFFVHRIIALTWVDGYQEGLTVNHIDGNPLNNKAENLEWLTREDNYRHALKLGLMDSHKRPITLEDKDGNMFHFNSLVEASLFLGRRKRYCLETLKVKRYVFRSKITGEKFIAHVSERKN